MLSLLNDTIRIVLKTWKKNCNASTLLYAPTGNMPPYLNFLKKKEKTIFYTFRRNCKFFFLYLYIINSILCYEWNLAKKKFSKYFTVPPITAKQTFIVNFSQIWILDILKKDSFYPISM